MRAFAEVFWIALRLGCISFGGPVAHLGYFKEAFVSRRKWLDEARYTELLGLCQFVPGPSSSQLLFAIGWQRGGLSGACAAWLGFTLPSALLMIGFAYGLFAFGEQADPIIRGLLIAAVAVVAKAVLGLGRKLCPDGRRMAIALASAGLLVWQPGSYLQIAAIGLGGLAGYWWLRDGPAPACVGATGRVGAGPRTVTVALALYGLLLALALWVRPGDPGALYALHYRAGALVFGGGHVVLPLLDDSIVAGGLVSEANFLAGYSAAQALPGPLFTFSAFLGTVGNTVGPAWAGGLLALAAIFLPGMLLLVGLLPFWGRIRSQVWAQAALNGANAAVVGLLVAAFIDPVWSHGIHQWTDFVLAAAAFAALQKLDAPPWLVVTACGAVGYWLG